MRIKLPQSQDSVLELFVDIFGKVKSMQFDGSHSVADIVLPEGATEDDVAIAYHFIGPDGQSTGLALLKERVTPEPVDGEFEKPVESVETPATDGVEVEEIEAAIEQGEERLAVIEEAQTIGLDVSHDGTITVEPAELHEVVESALLAEVNKNKRKSER
jgi:hypothetical protein